MISLIQIRGINYLVRINWISDKTCSNLIWNNNWSHDWWVVDRLSWSSLTFHLYINTSKFSCWSFTILCVYLTKIYSPRCWNEKFSVLIWVFICICLFMLKKYCICLLRLPSSKFFIKLSYHIFKKGWHSMHFIIKNCLKSKNKIFEYFWKPSSALKVVIFCSTLVFKEESFIM